MADIANLKIGANSYSIKDTTARSTAGNADTKATNANTKIDGASITGTYTAGTETLELSLTLGTVAQNNG